MGLGIRQILTLIGSLGLFLYGVKLVSESVQRVSSEKLSSLLTGMASSKIKALFAGIFITVLIQSSAATTVMVVSFVNAGMLSLTESISMIMGANIGTAFNVWLISLLGFKLEISVWSLAMIGVALPILFSKNRMRKFWAELILGFALLFLGLQFLRDYLPQVSAYPQFATQLHHYCSLGIGSYIIFFTFGGIIAMILQSSIAIIFLTIIACSSGWIGYDIAATMILGESLGSSLIASWAARGANTTAKRAALFHLIFNVFSIAWVVPLFNVLLQLVAKMSIFLSIGDPFQGGVAVMVALPLFATLFKLVSALLLIGFVSSISMSLTRRIPQWNTEESFNLQHIKIGLLSSPEASLFQAKKEILVFSEKVKVMLSKVVKLYKETDEKKIEKLVGKIEKSEEFCDRLEVEIANYLTKIGENRLSPLNARRLRAMYKYIDELESIGDSCMSLCKSIVRKKDQKIAFPDQVDNNLSIMFALVGEAVTIMDLNLRNEGEANLFMAQQKEEEINNFRDILKQEHLSNLETGVYNYQAGVIYNEIVSECEKLADFAINITEARKNIESL
ncbi:MAG: Na/Pi symporter [Bacteroidota bacterium]|nr:Na/Pi symporter [Bacteroidota bacterium]MDP4205495.1 Na/Pi symporter [Bacteroidota bacterium]